MSDERKPPLRVDRRTTLKWLAATMAAAQAGCAGESKFVGAEIPPASSTMDVGASMTSRASERRSMPCSRAPTSFPFTYR